MAKKFIVLKLSKVNSQRTKTYFTSHTSIMHLVCLYPKYSFMSVIRASSLVTTEFLSQYAVLSVPIMVPISIERTHNILSRHLQHLCLLDELLQYELSQPTIYKHILKTNTFFISFLFFFHSNKNVS